MRCCVCKISSLSNFVYIVLLETFLETDGPHVINSHGQNQMRLHKCFGPIVNSRIVWCLGGGSPRYCCSYSCLCYYPVQVCRTVVAAVCSQRTAEYFAQFSQIYSMQIQFSNSNCESNLTLTIFCRFPQGD